MVGLMSPRIAAEVVLLKADGMRGGAIIKVK
jgi:hypothetical protein